jgi:hypothetical protein
MQKGVHEITWGVTKYPISKMLIEDGRSNFVLRNRTYSVCVCVCVWVGVCVCVRVCVCMSGWVSV